MTTLLDHLGKGTLSKPLLDAFVEWCVWQQARPALCLVLTKTTLNHLADQLNAAQDLGHLTLITERASQEIKAARQRTGPLGLSAAEAATYEYGNLLRVATDAQFDPEEAAFFAARVCGWGGWAASDFTQPTRKGQVEAEAREEQEAQLQRLWRQFGRPQT